MPVPNLTATYTQECNGSIVSLKSMLRSGSQGWCIPGITAEREAAKDDDDEEEEKERGLLTRLFDYLENDENALESLNQLANNAADKK